MRWTAGQPRSTERNPPALRFRAWYRRPGSRAERLLPCTGSALFGAAVTDLHRMPGHDPGQTRTRARLSPQPQSPIGLDLLRDRMDLPASEGGERSGVGRARAARSAGWSRGRFAVAGASPARGSATRTASPLRSDTAVVSKAPRGPPRRRTGSRKRGDVDQSQSAAEAHRNQLRRGPLKTR
jgi:hypothetical protein